MTYLEKLRMAIKVDRDVLSTEYADMVELHIHKCFIYDYCPGDCFPGAQKANNDCNCLFAVGCTDCWNQEAKANADR